MDVRDNFNLSIARGRERDGIAEISLPAVDFDILHKELEKLIDIENLVLRGTRGIDNELLRLTLARLALGAGFLFRGSHRGLF